MVLYTNGSFRLTNRPQDFMQCLLDWLGPNSVTLATEVEFILGQKDLIGLAILIKKQIGGLQKMEMGIFATDRLQRPIAGGDFLPSCQRAIVGLTSRQKMGTWGCCWRTTCTTCRK